MKKIMIGFCLAVLCLFFLGEVAGAGVASDYSIWLEKLREDALSSGIKSSTLDLALADVKPLDSIIKLDRAQPEFNKTLADYLAGAVMAERVKKGQLLLAQNNDIFARIVEKYQIQPRFILALWGIETSFGRHNGKVPVINALVTLAYDGRRSQYFRSELLKALTIVDRGLINFSQMKGSWAGAMGQVQFMPSTFLDFAVDGDGDGHIDLWGTREDYLSSAANYLYRSGWDEKYTWGREVMLQKELQDNDFGLEQQRLLAEWQKLGVRTIGAEDLPKVKIMASLIRPDGPQGRAFLVYDNYRVLLKWNRSHRFAIAVGTLADQIGQR